KTIPLPEPNMIELEYANVPSLIIVLPVYVFVVESVSMLGPILVTVVPAPLMGLLPTVMFPPAASNVIGFPPPLMPPEPIASDPVVVPMVPPPAPPIVIARLSVAAAAPVYSKIAALALPNVIALVEVPNGWLALTVELIEETLNFPSAIFNSPLKVLAP